MDVSDIFGSVPDPQSYSLPDYSLPKGEPVLPVAITAEELETLLALYDQLANVDATPAHHQTLYLFLTTCKGYHLAPHISFSPPQHGVETLYELFQRVVDQDVYLKRPRSVLE